jgi:hypothetical protein
MIRFNAISGLFLLILLSCTIHTKAAENTGRISGSIVNKSTKEPISFANITLLSEDDKPVSGCMSDENGTFSLEAIAFGLYRISVSCLGYKAYEESIELTADNSPMDIGQVALKVSAQKLSEVEIAEQRVKGKQKVDRTVFTINQKVKNTAADGLDVLKNIPGVSVDFQDNITLEGSGNIMYLVNGIKRNKDFVAQLNPGDINSVEIISNPGVEYDADIDAVINIVTNRRSSGGKGNISLQGSDPNNFMGNENVSIQYGNKDFRVFVSDRLHYENFPATQLIESQMMSGEDTITIKTTGNGRASWLNNSLNYGFDWFINDKNIINLYGNYYMRKSNSAGYEMESTEWLNSMIGSQYNLIQSSMSQNARLYHSLYYKHNFEEKNHQFSSQVNHYSYNSSENNQYEYTYLYTHPVFSNAIHQDRGEEIENNRERLEWKNDYKQKFGNIAVSAGALTYYQWFDNVYKISSDSRDKFVYDEFRQDAYLSAKGGGDAFQYSGGLRMASSNSNIDNDAVNSYVEFLPQMSLHYTINKTSSLKLSARRRISRPGLSELNPFKTSIDERNFSSGNPDLRPELHNRTELKYAVNIGNSYLAPKLFLNYTTNSIQNRILTYEDGTSLIRPENVGKRYEYGINLAGAIVIGRWLRMNPSLSVYQTEVHGPANYYDNQLSYRINGQLILSPFKKKQISFVANLRYHAPRLGYKSIIRRDLLLFAGINYVASNQFKGTIYFAPTFGGFTYQETERNDGSYYYLNSNDINTKFLIAIQVSYEFKWGNEVRKLKRDTDYERDGNGGTL